LESTARRPRRLGRLLRGLAWAVPVFVAIVYVGISVLAAEVLTRPANHVPLLDPRVVGDVPVAWKTRTADNLTLRGWYYPSATHRRLIVLVHGLRAAWPEMAAVGHDLHALGYDVLLFDLRGHGRSDPARLSLGRRERGDLRAVLDWAGRQGFTPDRVGWLCNSMGASTLVMEAAQNPSIRVAVLDSPYGSLPELLDAQLSEYSHLPVWFNPGILAAAHLLFGVRTDDLVPIRFARRWGRRPLLLFHGESDTIVPVDQARRLAAAAGPSCQAVILPGVEHVQAYFDDPHRYIATVHTFFQRHLTP
jgi:alpha-beta hydrolase superfamily lysophospholipase